MNEIIFPVLLVAGIGLAAGIILSIASVIMNVPVDEKIEKINNVLPGANCGACGFSGCAGYAKALCEGKARVGLCSPGGEKVLRETSDILGVKGGKIEKKVAIVNCSGTYDNTDIKMQYQGEKSCSAAYQIFGGDKVCYYGCIGFGDCKNVCKYGAISVCNGAVIIDSEKCKGCLECVNACPKGLIKAIPFKKQAVVSCSSCDKGAKTRSACNVGCIGCMRCVKVCEHGAVSVENFLARVDPSKCTGCGKCIEVCKPGCIGIFDVKQQN